MKQAYRPLPTVEELWDLFSYNPLTGKLHRRAHFRANCIDRPYGCLFQNGYIVGEIGNVKHSAHRLIWKWMHSTEPIEVDHINGVRHDNRVWNLRNVTRSGNHCNRKNVRGWTRQKSGKYYALIGINGKQQYLGSFFTAEEARAAYEAAAERLHKPVLEQYSTVQESAQARSPRPSRPSAALRPGTA
jgi:hypothetical protein